MKRSDVVVLVLGCVGLVFFFVAYRMLCEISREFHRANHYPYDEDAYWWVGLE